MRWFAILLFVTIAVTGCQNYIESTPRKLLEGDNQANYQRVFGTIPDDDVIVINSVVVGYAWRPGVVTTDDFEFELLVTDERIKHWAKRFYLARVDSEFCLRELANRKQEAIRPWYAPKPIDSYELYRDATSVGYVHMLVDKELVRGQSRVFLSKH